MFELNQVLKDLENKIAQYIGTRYAIMCSSGRNAIRFSLLALGIDNYDDEVVVPDFTSQSLPIAVFCSGARLKFCDIDRETCALSPTHLPRVLRANTKAVIFVHPLGFPVDPTAIIEIAEKRGIAFIDDAAQALGATVNNKKAGSFGDIGILSFSKIIDFNLGGAITTDDKELAMKLKAIRAKYEQRSWFAYLSYHIMEICGLKSRKNMKKITLADQRLYRLLNIAMTKKYFQSVNGYIGANSHVRKLWRSNALTSAMINQLMTCDMSYWHRRRMEKTELLFLNSAFENLERRLLFRRRIAKMYDKLLKSDGFEKLSVSDNFNSSYLRYPIIFHDENRTVKSAKALFDAGFTVDCRYKPLHMSPFFDSINKDSDFKNSIYISKHILPLPIMFNMDFDMVKTIASKINAS